MKKYALKGNLNGVEIIKAIGVGSIDPEATKRVAKPHIELTPEFKNHAVLNTKYSDGVNALFALSRKTRAEKNPGRKAKLVREFQGKQVEIKALQNDCKEAYQELEKQVVLLREKHAIFFTPGDSFFVEPEFEAKFRALKPDTFLTVDGDVLTAQDLHTLRLSKMSTAEKESELRGVKHKLAREFAVTLKEFELLGDTEGEKGAKEEFDFRLKALEAAYV